MMGSSPTRMERSNSDAYEGSSTRYSPRTYR